MTKEHVWPQWIGRDLVPPQPLPPLADRVPHIQIHTSATDDGGSVVIQPVLRGLAERPHDVRVKVVCRHCNNGWMADLERTVKPVITDLERGSPTSIGIESGALLALWAAKTAAMFQYNDHYSKAVTPEQLSLMHRDGHPPPGMGVWLGRIAEDSSWTMRLRHTGGTVARPDFTHGHPRPIARFGLTTLTIERLVFYVTTVSRTGLVTLPAAPAPFIRLWPEGDTHAWPVEDAAVATVLGLTTKTALTPL